MFKATKTQTVKRLLAGPIGTMLENLCSKTGGRSHSVRAFLSGQRNAGTVIERGGRGSKAKIRLMP